MKRYYLQLCGQVQGVGLRHRFFQLAVKYNISGWCRNMTNGQVEAQIQGEKVTEFIKEITKNHGFIAISDYFIKEIPPELKEKNFTIRY